MTDAFAMRGEKEYVAEQKFLTQRILEIEKGMGKVAARTHDSLTTAQNMDALDRARELTGDLFKLVRVQSLEEAVQVQLAWLARAEANLAADNGEPKLDLNRIALDRRLLTDLLELWRARRN